MIILMQVISSVFVWLSGAYAICALIRAVHGSVDFKIVTLYLAGVAFTQCIGYDD